MERKTAINIMGLDETYTKEQIIKRYDVLTKKFKGIDTDERGYTFKDITKAYNLLMDVSYRDVELEEKRSKRKQNPNKLLALMGTDEEKVENFFYHYKGHVIFAILSVILVFVIVFSILNNKPVDLIIDCIGSMTYDGQTQIEEYSVSNIDGVRGIEVNTILYGEELEYGQQDMILVETLGNDVDIYIVDREFFDRYAKRGLFYSLDYLAEELGAIDDRNVHSIVETDVDGNIISEHEPAQYGISITDNEILKSFGIEGNDLLICIGVRSKNRENAESFVRLILEK